MHFIQNVYIHLTATIFENLIYKKTCVHKKNLHIPELDSCLVCIEQNTEYVHTTIVDDLEIRVPSALNFSFNKSNNHIIIKIQNIRMNPFLKLSRCYAFNDFKCIYLLLLTVK